MFKKSRRLKIASEYSRVYNEGASGSFDDGIYTLEYYVQGGSTYSMSIYVCDDGDKDPNRLEVYWISYSDVQLDLRGPWCRGIDKMFYKMDKAVREYKGRVLENKNRIHERFSKIVQENSN